MNIHTTHDGFDVVPLAFDKNVSTGRKFGLRIVCSRCNKHYLLPTKSVAQSSVSEFIQKRFEAAGWRVAKKRNADLCPDCATVKKITLAPAPAGVTVQEEEKTTMLNKQLTLPIAKAPKVVMTRPEAIKMHSLMERVLVKRADGTFQYENGYDDARVAHEIDSHLNAEHARTLRREMFGNLYRPRQEKVAPKDLAQRVDELETMVLELNEKIGNMWTTMRQLHPNRL